MLVFFVIFSAIACVMAGGSMAMTILSHKETDKRIDLLEDKVSEGTPLTDVDFTKTVERERVIIDRTEPSRGQQMWFILREITKKGLTITSVTTNIKTVSGYKKPKDSRLFMNTVLAYSGTEAKDKANALRSWKEL